MSTEDQICPKPGHKGWVGKCEQCVRDYDFVPDGDATTPGFFFKPRPAPSAGSERCPRCGSPDKGLYGWACEKPYSRNPWHSAPQSAKGETKMICGESLGLSENLIVTCSRPKGHSGSHSPNPGFNDPLTPAPAQGADWTESAAQEIVAQITESITFVVDYTSDDWRKKIAEIVARHAAHVTAAKDAEIGRMRRAVEHIQKWGHGSYTCHISPDKDALERNKSVETEGERIRGELVDFLNRNRIVGMMLDTEEHVVRVDIVKLPPNIKPVLTLWGSIYVKDESEASHES